MDGGSWGAAVYGVAKSRTRLSDFPFTLHFHALEKEMATHSSVLCPENPRDGGAWWAAVYGVAQSRTRLKRLSSSSSSSNRLTESRRGFTGVTRVRKVSSIIPQVPVNLVLEWFEFCETAQESAPCQSLLLEQNWESLQLIYCLLVPLSPQPAINCLFLLSLVPLKSFNS